MDKMVTKKSKIKKILIDIAFTLGVCAAIFAVWAIAASTLDVDLILPSPGKAFGRFFAMFKESVFWKEVAQTFLRAVYSFAASFVIALFLAVVSSVSNVAKRIITPLVAIIRAVPTMAVILLLIIWLSPSTAPAVVAIIVICPTLYSAFFASIESVDHSLVEMSRVYKVKTKDVIFKLYLPNMAPQLFENTASGFSLNLKLVIAAEALAQTANSIGKAMQFAKITIEPTELFALTITSVILGVAAEALIRLIGKKVIRWQNA